MMQFFVTLAVYLAIIMFILSPVRLLAVFVLRAKLSQEARKVVMLFFYCQV
jgi:hypothetical protein